MLTTTRQKYWIKLNCLPSNYLNLPFGRQIEFRQAIREFKESANFVYVSIKRKTAAAALREFKFLYVPSEYYAVFNDSPECRDDSFGVWYK